MINIKEKIADFTEEEMENFYDRLTSDGYRLNDSNLFIKSDYSGKVLKGGKVSFYHRFSLSVRNRHDSYYTFGFHFHNWGDESRDEDEITKEYFTNNWYNKILLKPSTIIDDSAGARFYFSIKNHKDAEMMIKFSQIASKLIKQFIKIKQGGKGSKVKRL